MSIRTDENEGPTTPLSCVSSNHSDESCVGHFVFMFVSSHPLFSPALIHSLRVWHLVHSRRMKNMKEHENCTISSSSARNTLASFCGFKCMVMKNQIKGGKGSEPSDIHWRRGESWESKENYRIVYNCADFSWRRESHYHPHHHHEQHLFCSRRNIML